MTEDRNQFTTVARTVEQTYAVLDQLQDQLCDLFGVEHDASRLAGEARGKVSEARAILHRQWCDCLPESESPFTSKAQPLHTFKLRSIVTSRDSAIEVLRIMEEYVKDTKGVVTGASVVEHYPGCAAVVIYETELEPNMGELEQHLRDYGALQARTGKRMAMGQDEDWVTNPPTPPVQGGNYGDV